MKKMLLSIINAFTFRFNNGSQVSFYKENQEIEDEFLDSLNLFNDLVIKKTGTLREAFESSDDLDLKFLNQESPLGDNTFLVNWGSEDFHYISARVEKFLRENLCVECITNNVSEPYKDRKIQAMLYLSKKNNYQIYEIYSSSEYRVFKLQKNSYCINSFYLKQAS